MGTRWYFGHCVYVQISKNSFALDKYTINDLDPIMFDRQKKGKNLRILRNINKSKMILPIDVSDHLKYLNKRREFSLIKLF